MCTSNDVEIYVFWEFKFWSDKCTKETETTLNELDHVNAMFHVDRWSLSLYNIVNQKSVGEEEK